VKYLTGKQELPHNGPSSYALGSEEEAVICARALADAWRATPGNAEWLRTETGAKKAREPRR
jgi:hypothetical protein